MRVFEGEGMREMRVCVRCEGWGCVRGEGVRVFEGEGMRGMRVRV